MSEAHDSGSEPVRGATPLTPFVSQNGSRVVNNVAHLLAVSTAVVAVVVAVCVTVLASERRLTSSDVVTLYTSALGINGAVVAAQSLRRSA